MSFALSVSCGEGAPRMLPACGGGRGDPSVAALGQKRHRRPRERLGLSPGSSQPLLLGMIPALPRSHPPVLAAPSANWCVCVGGGGMRRVRPSPDPRRGRQAKAVPFLGRFPARCWVTAQPTHRSIRRTLAGLLNCLPAARPWACQPPPGLPGAFLSITPGAAFVLLSKAAAKPKPAAGKVRSGQGKPAACCGEKMAGTKSVPTSRGG